MTTAGFDGSHYRREVLTQLRERNPAEVEDLFWLAHVPRTLDDSAAIAARLRDTKGFLNKERSRQRQAAIATAVLKEWPRVEEVLTNPGARAALRARLGTAPQPGAGAAPAPRRRAARSEDPLTRRRRQVTANLAELARLRAEPELGSDLYAFLGLPTTATRPIVAQRLGRVGEVNRRRRPDRERTLVDELLVQARELLVDGDPAAYMAGFGDDARDGVVDALLAGDAAAAVEAHRRAARQHVAGSAILDQLREPAARSTTIVPVSAIGLGTWCAACGTINGAGAHACAVCATALNVACPQCRAVTAVDGVSCPSCAASLEPARAPLLARRDDRRAEQEALAQVDAAPEGERQALLARLAAQHPHWAQVRQRLSSAPPLPPEHVTVSVAGDEARLTWPQSTEAGVDAYLVERHEGTASRVLGRTGMTSWSDALAPGDDVRWTVRALRGDAAASAPTTATPAGRGAAVTGAIAGVQARAAVPVELEWSAPAGAHVVLERIERGPRGEIHRQLSVDGSGYRDRHVARGRTYEYRISLAGQTAAPVILTLTAGSGALATPGAAAPRPARRPAPAAPAPAPPRPPAAVVDQVAATREGDGRLRVTWQWPEGVTEAYVAYDRTPPADARPPGRKVTNMRYDLDRGALLDDVPSGAHVVVVAGRRDASGTLHWASPEPRSRTVAP